MSTINYFDIIHKYICPSSPTYPIYIIHCHLVTNKALKIGRRLGLDRAQLRFIEEAGMLHDIGIVNVYSPSLHCYGQFHYLCHGYEGRKILKSEGLPAHGRVAERHTGTGLSKQDLANLQATVSSKKWSAPLRNMLAKTIEEEIISFADLFFSKGGNLWEEKPLARIRKSVRKHGPEKEAILEDWIARFLSKRQKEA